MLNTLNNISIETIPTYFIKPYKNSYKAEWDLFISLAKNGTFLFQRDFMDYHNDRFTDASLFVYKKNQLIAVLPANIDANTLYSHKGLTYGGLLYSAKLKLNQVIGIYKCLLEYLKSIGISSLQIKELPNIYQSSPNDEFKYVAFLLEAKLLRRDALSVIDYGTSFKIASNRKEGVKKAEKQQLEIKEDLNFEGFWNEILIPNLNEKYQTNPVHSLAEITLLNKRFPNNIRQFNVYHNTVLVAGTTIFETDKVAHCQYISAYHDKNRLGSLDFLHYNLINNVFKDKAFYDFGISNENNGKNINGGLLFWKEGFGARTVTQDVYNINTDSSHLLNKVLI